MSLKNVRERTSHIARLGRLLAVIPNGGENTSASVIPAVLGYLVAQLKVNYRPLYAGIISLLADLAEQHGETIWSVIWQELQKINTAKGVIVVDLDNENPVWATSGDSRSQAYGPDIEDKEKDFRCHNLERNLSAVDRAGKESSDMGQLDAGGVSVSTVVQNDTPTIYNTIGSNSISSSRRAQLRSPTSSRSRCNTIHCRKALSRPHS